MVIGIVKEFGQKYCRIIIESGQTLANSKWTWLTIERTRIRVETVCNRGIQYLEEFTVIKDPGRRDVVIVYHPPPLACITQFVLIQTPVSQVVSAACPLGSFELLACFDFSSGL
ncbi:PREDICTED: uncharacterized protein LOC104597690 [Nelumbo nucifera]|uniref:Uncharacterized protein LOC104597690 n=1 Tax=Nelumbo nucifera TaxID=4432 RepID=A0A1U7ZTN3_NELNU|nr:PREDICTED: uncharacterized protein LOC104597690 [Nelumbo nucifera]